MTVITSEQRAQALAILRQDYLNDVETVVQNLKDEIAAGNITDREEADDWLRETVDGHSRVIYTGQAIECLLFSDNDMAYFEETGDGKPDNWSVVAFYAFERDVLEAAGDLGDLIEEYAPGVRCAGCGDKLDEPYTDDILTTSEGAVYEIECIPEDARASKCAACDDWLSDASLDRYQDAPAVLMYHESCELEANLIAMYDEDEADEIDARAE